MLRTLLYINEDLASSIALRFTDYLNKFIPLSLFISHVEECDEKEQAGTGLVRRTWEEGVTASGKQLVDRMLRTENIDCPLAGRPKVIIGDRVEDVTYELQSGGYKLFIEGYLNTADPENFFSLISSPLYTKAPCPTLVVKNLSISKKCALLCDDTIDPQLLVKKALPILTKSSFGLDIVYFTFQENDQLAFQDKAEGGSTLAEIEALLADAGITPGESTVLSGTPEQVGDYLKEYALVASPLPTRKTMRMQVLANSLASVLLVR